MKYTTVPLELLDFCGKQGLEMDGHLIDNPLYLSYEEAKQFSPLWVLRWRRRQCNHCKKNFDVTQEGLYYCCHDCLLEGGSQ